ncbi:2,3-dihydroxybiphenyl 1,2-dioxygenase [[Actinomadura] parvosata subsp. kistnae]|uniref:Dioxygenase n=1 Tax=[Actinomadura] parvosata subsp. kistnae TaxID=1909395 RepID=A0A1U9ZX71_9ACTN|nr:VOC family protein [Nonomuraea sp. ATCC 55076]AQZ62537.1 dioxygenase [Nonomuraea sp. ATCC 55076]SPL88794.1 2,3-dihydroxybiphenyl 1,2-dioxygenase [Actinomadura parvosata subsp. kistnae]
MGLHRLTTVAIGVPNLAATARFYADFGLTPVGRGTFATAGGGEQLTLVTAPHRRLLELGVGVEHEDDLHQVASSLTRLGLPFLRDATSLTVRDPGTGVEVRLEIAARIAPSPAPVPAAGAPGIGIPTGERTPAGQHAPVRPRKLGNVTIGSPGHEASRRFFLEGLGLKESDRIPGVTTFMRCSTDHHDVTVQKAPVTMLHHTSWQVNDVDEVGRGATAMLAEDPARHLWGLGRHHIGSSFFWYLKDPAGNFAEYYADMDRIPDDQPWIPQDWLDARGLYRWGPPTPAAFLSPDDLAELLSTAYLAG